jgi:hypothetical protein
VATVALASCAVPAVAAGAVGKVFTISKAERAPEIDGQIGGDEWSDAAIVEDFVQIAPVEFATPSERTVVYVKYDADTLYVAARLLDSEPGGIAANVMRQGENLQDDDSFGVVLSPFNDQRSGYWFELNANSVRRQAIFQDVTNRNFDWRGIWRGIGRRDREGWVAEMAIPMKTLAFPESSDQWGITFRRKIERKRESMGWTSLNRRFNPSTTGRMVGLAGLVQGIGLDVVPSVSLRNDRRFDPGATDQGVEPSVDLFYKITPAVAASLSVNTDFSATDVDDRQVNLTRFGLFFPEKRAFFLQDADIFDFGRLTSSGNETELAGSTLENGRPFFSRRIGLSASGLPVDLRAGGKLTGRAGRWSFGLLDVQQTAFGDVESRNLLAARVAANVLAESSVGMIVTHGDPRSNRGNTVVGTDFRYQNSNLPGIGSVIGEAWFQQSKTDGLAGDDAAWGLRLEVPNETGLRTGIGVKSLGRNFLPALGFVNNPGIRDYTMQARYTRNAGGFLQSLIAALDLQRIESLGEGLQTQAVLLRPLELEMASGEVVKSRVSALTEVLYEDFEISDGVTLKPGRYSFTEYAVSLETAGYREISGELQVGAGGFYGGRRTSVDAVVTWRPSPHFAFSARYEHFDVDLPEGDFVTRLIRARVDVVFSSQLSWSNLLQYDNESEVVGLNSRLQWIPQAGRELFFVVNHAMEDVDRDDRFRSQRQEAVLKVGYTLRF